MACKNATCKYNDDKTRNGCTLFLGASWLNCRGASAKPVAKKTNIHQKQKQGDEMKELKGYNINGHTVALYMDNVCGMPFFVVRCDGGETFAGRSRQDAIDAFDAACARASKEVQNG